MPPIAPGPRATPRAEKVVDPDVFIRFPGVIHHLFLSKRRAMVLRANPLINRHSRITEEVLVSLQRELQDDQQAFLKTSSIGDLRKESASNAENPATSGGNAHRLHRTSPTTDPHPLRGISSPSGAMAQKVAPAKVSPQSPKVIHHHNRVNLAMHHSKAWAMVAAKAMVKAAEKAKEKAKARQPQ